MKRRKKRKRKYQLSINGDVEETSEFESQKCKEKVGKNGQSKEDLGNIDRDVRKHEKP